MRLPLSIFFLFSFGFVFSQVDSREIAETTAIKYGLDDILINGSNYFPLHPVASGDAFFIENAFYEGSLHLKGRNFENVLLKFDIEQQKGLLKLDSISAKYSIIQLNNNYIKEFRVHGLTFVNLNSRAYYDDEVTFLELIYDGSFIFGKYYSKVFLPIFSTKYPYGKYSETKTEKYIFRNGNKIRIKSKKDLYKVFPGNKNAIKHFIKQNKIKFRKASNKKLLILMKYCDGL